MKFKVNIPFQFMGIIRRESSELIVDKGDLFKEIACGKKANGRYVSGLLNHCTPSDEETANFVYETELSKPEPPKPEPKAPTVLDEADEITAIREEFNRIGKAYHHFWKLPRLKTELIKAKKETGE